MHRTILFAALAIALGGAAVAPLDSARGRQDPPKEPLTVTIAVDKATPVLGDEVQLEVKIENTGEKDLDLAEVILEERSLSFEITIESSGGRPPKKFTYSLVRPDPHVSTRLPLSRFTLPKGKSAVAYFKVPTLKAGAMTVVALYKGGEKDFRSAEQKVTVGPTTSGGKLSAFVETSKGIMTIELAPEEAPANVINFVNLARSGFYNGLIFHRVIRDSWIQTGCPYGLGIGGPGYAIRSEAKDSTGKTQDVKHALGTVSMCGFEKSDFNGSQFFISLAKIEWLDGKYTIMGKVTDEASLKVLQDIGKSDTDKNTDRPKPNDIELKKVTISVK